jgi:alpha-L-fucosidase 2
MNKFVFLFFSLVSHSVCGQSFFRHDLHFSSLAKTWDEGVPLGNGIVGNLVWQKEGKLRFSLDRADLWDVRPMKDIDRLNFKMIKDQVAKNDYKIIQELGDIPYEREPAPSKIPGAALEFDISSLGDIASTHLYIKEGIAEVKWKNGTSLKTFIHPELPIGWFRFESATVIPVIVPPSYAGNNTGTGNSIEGQGLSRLGYQQGTVARNKSSSSYEQVGWNGFVYTVFVSWQTTNGGIEGCWSITSNSSYNIDKKEAKEEIVNALVRGFETDLAQTKKWWANFWDESNLILPDSIIERQWYLENYKFGCIARSDAPPITLQAIWTADNGNLPPWKGDIHNDLNTQLSYWPSYSGNHLNAASGFTNWLWANKSTFEKYTKRFFDVEGLNVPGVTTLDGKDMGGWVQYSYSTTVAGWLAHHFYLQWRYSMDRQFLKEKAYPWLKGFAQFIENISVKDKKGKRKLPLSSSPEFYDNTIKAWFQETTNYDLGIIRWSYLKAAELAAELGLENEATHWKEQLKEWPELSLDKTGSLALAPGLPYPESHRHFSHLMGFHPLGILDYSIPADKRVIDASMKLLEEKGSDFWVGYSFSWQANMYARMMNGNKASETLRKFATCFCLPNSFHVNGDQCEGKLSKFRYRPFTLEGNFAFASAVQEMLLQSHRGIITLFPAIPSSWNNVSFSKLRSEGAFVISAKKENGKVTEIVITSEKGGELVLENAIGAFAMEGADFQEKKGLIRIQTIINQQFVLRAK